MDTTIATDANELFLFGGYLKQRRENLDRLIIVGEVHYKNQHRLPTQLNGRYYWETRSRHLIQDRYYSPVKYRLQPETHPRIITWYGFQGSVYKKTKAGEIMIETTLDFLRVLETSPDPQLLPNRQARRGWQRDRDRGRGRKWRLIWRGGRGG